jgi:hypothetical protein
MSVPIPMRLQTHIMLGLRGQSGGDKTGFTGYVLHTDSIEETCETLKARGVNLSKELSTESWGKWAQFIDPDGNEFGIKQSCGVGAVRSILDNLWITLTKSTLRTHGYGLHLDCGHLNERPCFSRFPERGKSWQKRAQHCVMIAFCTHLVTLLESGR